MDEDKKKVVVREGFPWRALIFWAAVVAIVAILCHYGKCGGCS